MPLFSLDICTGELMKGGLCALISFYYSGCLVMGEEHEKILHACFKLMHLQSCAQNCKTPQLKVQLRHL